MGPKAYTLILLVCRISISLVDLILNTAQLYLFRATCSNTNVSVNSAQTSPFHIKNVAQLSCLSNFSINMNSPKLSSAHYITL